jgi:folate-dependent phosphoribosylglycinamide formyltransferase PurN
MAKKFAITTLPVSSALVSFWSRGGLQFTHLVSASNKHVCSAQSELVAMAAKKTIYVCFIEHIPFIKIFYGIKEVTKKNAINASVYLKKQKPEFLVSGFMKLLC